MAKRKRPRSSRQRPSVEPPVFELLVKRSRSSRQLSSAELPTLMLGRSAEAMPALCGLLDLYRRRFEKGDYAALLDALFAWLSSCQGPPAWIADAFCEKLLDWFEHRAPTLDAAFGVKRPRGKHLKALRERQDLRGPILTRSKTCGGEVCGLTSGFSILSAKKSARAAALLLMCITRTPACSGKKFSEN